MCMTVPLSTTYLTQLTGIVYMELKNIAQVC